MADEFVSVTVVGNPGEPAADLAARLTAFWTHLLRTRPDDYVAVFAEAVGFETVRGAVSRQYMVEAGAAETITCELAAAELAFEPVDFDDVYSKYEVSGSEWFQLDH